MGQGEETELLREMRDLLRVIAEPALAKRDEKLRTSLAKIIGKSEARSGAVRLMDGSRTQAVIRKDCGIDVGNLSRLVKALRTESLIGADDKRPKLAISIPSNFFDKTEGR